MRDEIVFTTADLLRYTRRVAVAIGVFDGVHIGHQKILRELLSLADSTSAEPVVLFFDPHPRAVLSAEAPKLLSNFYSKTKLLFQHGAKYLVSLKFTEELAALTPEVFLERTFLVPDIEVTGFCVGENWRFGKGNSGNGETLNTWAKPRGMQVRAVEQVSAGGGIVSSTRIREAVAAGRLEEAEKLLGVPFTVSGEVRHGNGIGGPKLGYPTANLVEPDYVMPPFGVYAASANWDNKSAIGIVYVGEAPTIRQEQREVFIELHLFDLQEDLYGKELSVHFHQFIRPSIKFSSPEELASQIHKDVAQVHQLFGR